MQSDLIGTRRPIARGRSSCAKDALFVRVTPSPLPRIAKEIPVITNENATRACPVCNSEGYTAERISRDPWRVARCEDCSFVYLQNPPALEQLMAEFSWDKTVETESIRRKAEQPVLQWFDRKTRWRLHMFERPESRKFLEKAIGSGNVLDLGCGDGRHAMALSEAYTPFGVEIAPVLAEAADKAFAGRAVIAFPPIPCRVSGRSRTAFSMVQS